MSDGPLETVTLGVARRNNGPRLVTESRHSSARRDKTCDPLRSQVSSSDPSPVSMDRRIADLPRQEAGNASPPGAVNIWGQEKNTTRQIANNMMPVCLTPPDPSAWTAIQES